MRVNLRRPPTGQSSHEQRSSHGGPGASACEQPVRGHAPGCTCNMPDSHRTERAAAIRSTTGAFAATIAGTVAVKIFVMTVGVA